MTGRDQGQTSVCVTWTHCVLHTLKVCSVMHHCKSCCGAAVQSVMLWVWDLCFPYQYWLVLPASCIPQKSPSCTDRYWQGRDLAQHTQSVVQQLLLNPCLCSHQYVCVILCAALVPKNLQSLLRFWQDSFSPALFCAWHASWQRPFVGFLSWKCNGLDHTVAMSARCNDCGTSQIP